MKTRLFILALAVVLMAMFAMDVTAKETERSAKVIFVKADVKIQKAGKTDWVSAKEGMSLFDGDTIKTGRASSIELSFDKENKNIVRLEENSTAILRGKMLNRIELPQGRIRSLVKNLKRGSSFEIKTPTVVAGARGSGWDVDSTEKRDGVKALEDEIFVQSYDQNGNLIKEILVREGWEVIIDRFQAPGELIELTDRDKGDWNSWREDLKDRVEPPKEETQEGPAEFGNVQSIEQAVEKQDDYKQDIVETQDINKIEDRITEENKPPETEEGSGGGGCPGY